MGGAGAVTEFFTFVPTAGNAAYYIEILFEKYRLRSSIEVAETIIAAAQNPAAGVDAAEVAQSGLLKIAGLSESRASTKHIRDIVDAAPGLLRRDRQERREARGHSRLASPRWTAPPAACGPAM